MNKNVQRDNNIWVFNDKNDFTGNPKWLFIYINKFRKDIKAYWYCDDPNTVKFIRKLGFRAYTYRSKSGMAIKAKAGVFVCNQVKEVFPASIRGAKILNLWHGVGCKSIERKLSSGMLFERIAKKYIKYNDLYSNNQLFLVTSPLMEAHFKEQCGVGDYQVIRGGYPCCMHNQKFKFASYNHDILKEKGLSKDTRIAVYAPTYRDHAMQDFMLKAIPNIERLIKKLEEEKMLLIFKMHPLMAQDFQYNQLKEHYGDCKNLLFWDNSKDFYEVFDQIDLAIVDYSSIFYDMLSAGVPNFIRYFFDYNDGSMRESVFDYKEMTCGKICDDFDSLIETLSNYKEDNTSKREEIEKLFWEYTTPESFDHIIDETLKYEIKDKGLRPLYSFDIFDTLIERKSLFPISIFYYVKEKMQNSDIDFPSYLIKNFVNARRQAEANVREYYRKTTEVRDSDKIEISFREIYERMADLYTLSSSQIEMMMQWELEAEYENIIPIHDKIDMLKELVKSGETVVLISDMYLPKEFIIKLLEKCDPILTKLPLFLSSDYGVQKSTKKLYLEVYKALNYNFKEWIHYGDNNHADRKMPAQLAINPQIHKLTQLSEYEQNLIETINSYDSFLVARMFAKFRENHTGSKEIFAHSYISLYLIPYVSWAVKDAVKKGTECLYFVSRDGHYLKIIADEIIKIKKLNIKTKYMYGSRKVWRIPSFIDHIDDEFFYNFGNFTGVKNFDDLLEALAISEKEFVQIFPEWQNVMSMDNIDKRTLNAIVNTSKHSQKYKDLLLNIASKQRKIVDEYFKQEMNFNEKFAFVEYWGRGYTQDCFARLIQNASNTNMDVPCYYLRTIYPTIGTSVRYNFSSNTKSITFIEELILGNLPYESLKSYGYKDNKVVPNIVGRKCDEELHRYTEKYLVEFCDTFYNLNLLDEDRIERELFDFSLNWFEQAPEDQMIYESIGDIKGTISLHGGETAYAPPIKWKDVVGQLRGVPIKGKTKSLKVSLARSSKPIRLLYWIYKKVIKFKFIQKLKGKVKRILKKIK